MMGWNDITGDKLHLDTSEITIEAGKPAFRGRGGTVPGLAIMTFYGRQPNEVIR